jgi:acylphosphatase
MIYKRYLVTGRVQGVGYRRFTSMEAKALGLKGGTRNLHDGRVEIVACGSRESLEFFEHALSRGPMGSSVSQIEVHELSPDCVSQNFNGFDTDFIVHTDGVLPWV